jgi:hypothetical protein
VEKTLLHNLVLLYVPLITIVFKGILVNVLMVHITKILEQQILMNVLNVLLVESVQTTVLE